MSGEWNHPDGDDGSWMLPTATLAVAAIAALAFMFWEIFFS
ncbi:hypothetical protein LCGC14_0674250 [marine sediment metagenome]|uniref:Uncharacterized protein n=1 Tax=marine sediment metagenome TaxID=412755 RepID=A0A0F9TY46_9ZZZZ